MDYNFGPTSFCFVAGQEFLVMHHVLDPHDEARDVAFLCLLCRRILTNEESYAHVFSGEHVTSFLVSIFICFVLALLTFAVNNCNMLTVASGLQQCCVSYVQDTFLKFGHL